MPSLHAASALTPRGWRRNVRVSFEGGIISLVEADVLAHSQDEQCNVLIPGMPNVHSHAFQRGMAGLAEVRGPADDNFWSWRTAMYRVALTMSPDDVEAIASQLYMEMLEAGFTRVGEFHYLHHDRDGNRYSNIAEMATRIVAAAKITGIGLTILPCFYAHSTFGGAKPLEQQRRFICDLDSFAQLVEGCRAAVNQVPGISMGISPHSLRAVTPEELAAVTEMAPELPVHIHAAEQTKEVEDCVAWSGARPVEWLLDHAEVNDRWCLIHATHMTPSEIQRLAKTGATVGLCPITEANLGDGIFSASDFLAEGGHIAIGSDSNVLIGLTDELRQLEYSQRLLHKARNIIAPVGRSTGRSLFDHALAGGGCALKIGNGLAVGQPADFVSLPASGSRYLTDDTLLDSWIFTNVFCVDSVWISGKKLVTGGRHVYRDTIKARFRTCMQRLAEAD